MLRGQHAEGGSAERTTAQPVVKAAPKKNVVQEEVAATTIDSEPTISKDPYESDDLDIPVFLRRQKKH